MEVGALSLRIGDVGFSDVIKHLSQVDTAAAKLGAKAFDLRLGASSAPAVERALAKVGETAAAVTGRPVTLQLSLAGASQVTRSIGDVEAARDRLSRSAVTVPVSPPNVAPVLAAFSGLDAAKARAAAPVAMKVPAPDVGPALDALRSLGVTATRVGTDAATGLAKLHVPTEDVTRAEAALRRLGTSAVLVTGELGGVTKAVATIAATPAAVRVTTSGADAAQRSLGVVAQTATEINARRVDFKFNLATVQQATSATQRLGNAALQTTQRERELAAALAAAGEKTAELETRLQRLEARKQRAAGASDGLTASIGRQVIALVSLRTGWAAVTGSLDAVDAQERAARKLQATANLTGQSLGTIARIARDAQRGLSVSSATAADLTQEFVKLTNRAGDVTRTGEVMSRWMDLAAAQGLTLAESLQAVNTTLAGNDEGLNRLGLANPQQIFEKWARAAGTTADKLSDAQRWQAIVNEVVAAGTRVQGEYQRALGTSAGKLQQFRTELEQTATSFGRSIQPARDWILEIGTHAVSAIRRFLDAEQEMERKQRAGLRILFGQGAQVRAEEDARRRAPLDQDPNLEAAIRGPTPAGTSPAVDRAKEIAVLRELKAAEALRAEDLKRARALERELSAEIARGNLTREKRAELEKMRAAVRDILERNTAAEKRGNDALGERIALLARGAEFDATRQEAAAGLALIESGIRQQLAQQNLTLKQRIELEEQLARAIRARQEAERSGGATSGPSKETEAAADRAIGKPIGAGTQSAQAIRDDVAGSIHAVDWEAVTKEAVQGADKFRGVVFDVLDSIEEHSMDISSRIGDAFGQTWDLMTSGAIGVGEALLSFVKDIGQGVLQSIAQMAKGKAIENGALAVEELAKGLAAAAVGNAAGASLHYAAAGKFAAAAIAWGVAGGAIGAIAGGGGGAAGAAGAGASSRETGASPQRERRPEYPTVHLVYDPDRRLREQRQQVAPQLAAQAGARAVAPPTPVTIHANFFGTPDAAATRFVAEAVRLADGRNIALTRTRRS